jgi:hypothetical protein
LASPATPRWLGVRLRSRSPCELPLSLDDVVSDLSLFALESSGELVELLLADGECFLCKRRCNLVLRHPEAERRLTLVQGGFSSIELSDAVVEGLFADSDQVSAAFEQLDVDIAGGARRYWLAVRGLLRAQDTESWAARRCRLAGGGRVGVVTPFDRSRATHVRSAARA